VDPLLLPAAGDAVELCEVPQVVEAREPLVQPAIAAEDVPDPLAYLARVAHDVAAEHAGLAGRRQEQRDQHLDRGRLTGSVRTEQSEQFAFGDLERDAAYGLDLEGAAADDSCRRTVGTTKPDDLDHRHVFDPTYGLCHRAFGRGTSD